MLTKKTHIYTFDPSPIDLMRFLLHLLIDPIFLWIILICIGIILHRRNKQKLARRWLLVAAVWLLLIGMTPLSTWLAYRMEYKYSVLIDPSMYKDSPRPVQIMVLCAVDSSRDPG